jgi:cysteine desulfurase
VATTSYVAFDGVAGELLMQALDLDGVAVSTGAACSSGSLEPSPVLRAIGFPEGIRVSLGAGNTAADIDRLLALLPVLLARILRA